jgi:probable rRNA maturation factor
VTTDLTVIAADERSPSESALVDVDVARWERLAVDVLLDHDASGELTLTFVDTEEIASLNAEHMGGHGPTDVLSFPLDDDGKSDVPTLLGDVVICPAVAAEQCAGHAGTVDDELALLVVHGILHVLGHDHAEAAEAERMRARELELLVAHHWGSAPPPGFRQTHD